MLADLAYMIKSKNMALNNVLKTDSCMKIRHLIK